MGVGFIEDDLPLITTSAAVLASSSSYSVNISRLKSILDTKAGTQTVETDVVKSTSTIEYL